MMVRRPWIEGPIGLGLLLAGDILAIFDAFALGYLVRFHWNWIGDESIAAPDPGEYAKAWFLGVAMIVTLYHAYGLYRNRGSIDPIAHFSALLRAGSVAIIFILALSYFYRGFSYSRLAVFVTCGVGLALSGGFRLAWESYCRRLRAAGKVEVPVVLVGSRDLPRFLARRMEQDRSLGIRMVAVVDDVAIESEEFAGLPRGGFEDLPRLIESTGAREVLIGHPGVAHHELLRMIEWCEIRGIRIRTVPATYDLVIDANDFEDVGGIPFVTVNERRARPWFRLWKRGFDLFFSTLGLILVSPLLVAVGLAIRWDSGSPVFFRQRRVGRDGRPFTMLKFRTMVPDAEARLADLIDLERLAEPVFKLDDDPRVTRVGRWLRRTSLDELPQLVNVVRGEMSLVGPRPEESRVVERYDIWERRRLKITPGITGLQQIHCRGSRSLKERVRWDILYLRRESVLLDLWILFRTLMVVVRGKGAR
ncbi:MAG: sugar transferase [Planctomycetes bacterium]|nr:sugar transferase [Planctomycetota bacterium]